MILPRNYFSQDIFEEEKEKYFQQNFCIGTTSNLDTHNSYKTANQYFEPLTIRNNQSIQVYSNVCLHRSGLIDIDEQGQSPFACKYHGWSYGFDGALLKTPLDESLKFCNKKLKVIPSSVQSEMIFINPTKGFLEDFKKSFDEDLISMGCFFYRSSILHNCNWKLLVENVLEPYHISFVHQDSFVSLGLTSTSPYEWGENKLGSFNRVKAKNNSNKFYYHQSIGHNLFVSDTDGLITFISFFFPISPNQTLLIFELWESASLSNRPMYVREKLRQEAIHFSNKVLLEDKKIVEASQIGIQHSQKTHTLSPLAEPRIIHFHETYQTAMRDS